MRSPRGHFSHMGNNDESRAPAKGEGEGNVGDERKADSDFDDLIIEVDESELESELTDDSPGKKY